MAATARVTAPDTIQRATKDMAAWQLGRMSNEELVEHGANLLTLIDNLHGEYNRAREELGRRFPGKKAKEEIVSSHGVGERSVSNRYFVLPGKEQDLMEKLGAQFGEWFDLEEKIGVLRGQEFDLFRECEKYGVDTEQYFKLSQSIKIRPILRAKIESPIPAPGADYEPESKPRPNSPADRDLIKQISPFVRVATTINVEIRPLTTAATEEAKKKK